MRIVVVARADGAGYVRSIGCASWLYIIARPALALNQAGPVYNPDGRLKIGPAVYNSALTYI